DRHRRKAGRIHLHDCQVAVWIARDDLAGELPTVVERHGELAGALDDVVVREDEAAAVVDEARADAGRRHRERIQVAAAGRLARDGDYGPAHARGDIDDGIGAVRLDGARSR